MGLANHYAAVKKVADGANEKIRQADQKRQKAKESLLMALDSNMAVEEKIKVLEAEIADTKKTAFILGRKEAEMDIAGQLTGIYNESFQEGWKTLYAQSGLGEASFLPPWDYLSYLDALTGVEEAAATETFSQPSASGVSIPPPV
ncbi:hypothetical protein FCV25MIE_20278 [Fagus crenata]